MGFRPGHACFSLLLGAAIATGVAAQAIAQTGVWSVLPISGTKPSARHLHTMVYDPAGNRVILFGGETPSVSGETWVLHLSGTPYWEQVAIGDPNAPPPLFGHNAVYDVVHKQMLVFGGMTTGSGFPNGVWALDGTSYTWSKLLAQYPTGLVNACPSVGTPCEGPYQQRIYAAATVGNGALYVMGGQGAGGHEPLSDLWSSTLGTQEWNWIAGSALGFPPDDCKTCLEDTPKLRFYHSLVADQLGRPIVFGGIYEDTDVSDASVWTGSSWSFFGTVPTTGNYTFGRKNHVAVFDPVLNRMVVIGGYFGSGATDVATGDVTSVPIPVTLPSYGYTDANNTWVLHPVSGTSPGPMADAAGVYDSFDDRIIMFGGVSDAGGTLRSNDVWVLHLDVTPPSAVTNLAAGQIGKNSSTITWTAPGDDGATGTALSYDLRRSTTTITDANFSSATPLATAPPDPAGSSECAGTGSVSPSTTYYYALKTTDHAGNTSALSNVLSIRQASSGVSYTCSDGAFAQPTVPEAPAELEFSVSEAGRSGGPVDFVVQVPPSKQGEPLDLSIYDLTGRQLRTLARSAATAGQLTLSWDRRDDGGAKVTRGVYFARLRVGSEDLVRRVIFLRQD